MRVRVNTIRPIMDEDNLLVRYDVVFEITLENGRKFKEICPAWRMDFEDSILDDTEIVELAFTNARDRIQERVDRLSQKAPITEVEFTVQEGRLVELTNGEDDENESTD